MRHSPKSKFPHRHKKHYGSAAMFWFSTLQANHKYDAKLFTEFGKFETRSYSIKIAISRLCKMAEKSPLAWK